MQNTTRQATHYNRGLLTQISLGEGRTFRVEETLVAIFRACDGQVFATQPTCPHRGKPLADGIIGAGKVICPLHSYKFAMATDEPLDNTCGKLQTYPIEIDMKGDIWLLAGE